MAEAAFFVGGALGDGGDGTMMGFFPPLLTGVGVLLRADADDDDCCCLVLLAAVAVAVVLALVGCGVVTLALGDSGWGLLPFFMAMEGVGAFGDDVLLFLCLSAAAATGDFEIGDFVVEGDDEFLVVGIAGDLPAGFLPAGVVWLLEPFFEALRGICVCYYINVKGKDSCQRTSRQHVNNKFSIHILI